MKPPAAKRPVAAAARVTTTSFWPCGRQPRGNGTPGRELKEGIARYEHARLEAVSQGASHR